MDELDRRQFAVGGVLAGAAALAAVARAPDPPPPASQDMLEATIPARVGAWRHVPAAGIVLPPQDELSKRIYDRYVARAYAADGQPSIVLVVAYGSTQDYGLQIHRPEICYPASGYDIGKSHSHPLRLGDTTVPAVALTASRAGHHDQILYWTRIGKSFPPSVWAERYAILQAALARQVPSGVLVRLSVSLENPERSIALLSDFARMLVAGLGPAGRAAFFGE